MGLPDGEGVFPGFVRINGSFPKGDGEADCSSIVTGFPVAGNTVGNGECSMTLMGIPFAGFAEGDGVGWSRMLWFFDGLGFIPRSICWSSFGVLDGFVNMSNSPEEGCFVGGGLAPGAKSTTLGALEASG